MQNLSSLILPIAFLVIFYFLLIRPQKKKEKKIKEMRGNLKVNDKVVTIGGIQGTIVKIKEDDITIEVGADRTKLIVARWSIGRVVNDDEYLKKD